MCIALRVMESGVCGIGSTEHRESSSHRSVTCLDQTVDCSRQSVIKVLSSFLTDPLYGRIWIQQYISCVAIYIFPKSIDHGSLPFFVVGNIPGHWSCHISDCSVVSKDSPHLDASGKEALPRTPAL